MLLWVRSRELWQWFVPTFVLLSEDGHGHILFFRVRFRSQVLTRVCYDPFDPSRSLFCKSQALLSLNVLLSIFVFMLCHFDLVVVMTHRNASKLMLPSKVMFPIPSNYRNHKRNNETVRRSMTFWTVSQPLQSAAGEEDSVSSLKTVPVSQDYISLLGYPAPPGVKQSWVGGDKPNCELQENS